MSSTKSWAVHKFGSCCLKNAAAFTQAASLVAEKEVEEKVAVVVTAIDGVTDQLIKSINLAKDKDLRYKTIINDLVADHSKLLIGMFNAEAVPFINQLNSEKDELLALLHAVYLSRQCTDAIWALITGVGELWSSFIFQQYLLKVQPGLNIQFLNARDVIVAEDTIVGKEVVWETTESNIAKWLESKGNPRLLEIFTKPGTTANVLVIPGFVASDKEGLASTLSRHSSDFSAAIFAYLLSAKSLTIWSKTEGVYSTDPSTVSEAVLLEELTYKEALELCFFGAKVIHPSAIQPCMEQGIPLYIRPFNNPAAPGTKIIAEAKPSKLGARGFSTVDGISLLNIEGPGMIGSPAIPFLLFERLRDINANTLMITKGSSEHSICLGIREEDTDRVHQALLDQFYREVKNHDIGEISVIRDCTILAVVGDDMINTCGIAGRVVTAFGAASVSILAISQGSSERNISIVIKTKDARVALKAVHDMFYVPLERQPCLHVALIGPGNVGKEVLKQISFYNAKQTRLQDKLAVDVIARSTKMLINSKAPYWIDIDNWEEEFEEKSIELDWAVLESLLLKFKSWNNNVVIIDCTSSEKVIKYYSQWASGGIHIVAANKKFFSGPIDEFTRFFKIIRENRVSCHFEATVGAGLPLIAPLRNFIVKTGDNVLLIEGVLSGTLAFIFNELKKGEQPFSEIVKKAKQLGYTEPDPRDDLSALDFARKLVILGRIIGLSISLSDVKVEGLVPASMESLTISEFMNQLSTLDAGVEERRKNAADDGKVLSFVGKIEIDPNTKSFLVTLGLTALPLSHPLATASGSVNQVVIQTDRYTEPMVINGPGAGPARTATGVVGDLLLLIPTSGN